jgi:hypothetical protein
VEWTEDNGTGIELIIGDEQLSPIVSILDDEYFRTFDPIADRDNLADRFYSLSFGQFLEMTEAVVASFAEPETADGPK